MSSVDDEFGEKLSKSLEQALGVRIVSVVYSILKSDFGIEKDEVPANPEVLKEVLRRIFGSAGLHFLEILISKEILAEFDLPDNLKAGDYILAEVLREARQKVSSE